MENKRTDKRRVFFARTLGVIVGSILISLILFKTPATASESQTYDKINKSNFFMKLIGNTVSVFKVSENSDDRKVFNGVFINPLKIIQGEISYLDEFKLKDKDVVSLPDKDKEEASSIVINPFKLKDEDVNTAESAVDIIGNPEDNSKKKILIYHTHTNEAYAEGNSGLSTTVAAVGDTLTEELQKLGFTVIHDKTEHDTGDYNNAYYKSRDTFTKYLNAYGDFDLVIDLHRDGGPSKDAVTTTVEGDSCARVMFVSATDNPRYSAQAANLDSILAKADAMYPGLIRERRIFTYLGGIIFYSQDLSDNAILMEVGADCNNLQEAKNSMKYMSKVFAAHLNSKWFRKNE